MTEELDGWFSENADIQIESGSREEKYLLEHNSFSMRDTKSPFPYIRVNLSESEAFE